jgi:signal transduction histidine kinase/ActR/RegA family two-component response regulator/PAS domain-containing protein
LLHHLTSRGSLALAACLIAAVSTWLSRSPTGGTPFAFLLAATAVTTYAGGLLWGASALLAAVAAHQWLFSTATETALVPTVSGYLVAGLVVILLTNQRRRSTDLLRLAGLELQLVAEATPALIFDLDRRARVRTCSQKLLGLLGGAGDPRGKHLSQLVSTQVFEVLSRPIGSALRGRPMTFEAELELGGGGYFQISITPRSDEHGVPDGCVALLTDISDRQREVQHQRFLAEASSILASPLELHAGLERMARCAVPSVADWTAIFLTTNSAFELAAAAHRDEGAGSRLAAFLARPEASRALAPVLERAVRGGMPCALDDLAAELAEHSHDGELQRQAVAWQLRGCVLAPLVGRGRTLGVLLVGRRRTLAGGRAATGFAEDVAHRIVVAVDNARLYAQEQQARAEAESLSRSKDEFLATLSHELRTPLNAILGWTQLFGADGLTEAERSRGLEVIERNARAQAELIEDLLDVSRIVSGKLHLDLQAVPIADVLEEALAGVAPAVAKKCLVVRRQLDHEVAVLGDPQRLQQVFWNLLSNATKFTTTGGHIEVTAAVSGREVQVTVRDDGMGIDPAFLPSLFERFRQADGSTTRHHGGLGIGLALVRSLVRAHGGVVRAESDGPGRGSAFHVLLPAHNAEAADLRAETVLAAANDATAPQSLAGLRVLLVEDDADSRELVSRIITGCGAEVMAVASAREAFQTIQTSRPDVLVTDIGLPDEDGYELLRRVRDSAGEGRWNLPAVALTAYASTHDRRRAFAAGFQAHVAKPVNASELTRVVARLAAAPQSLAKRMG